MGDVFAFLLSAYIIICAVFMVAALILDVFASSLTAFGLWTQDSIKKYKYYRMALYSMIATRE